MEPEKFTTQPEWLAKCLISEIHRLLRMDYYTADYGGFLYEAIGTIRMFVDQEFYHEIDLAGKLARLRFTNPGDTFGHLYPHEKRLPAFWKWKKETLTRRTQLGFPVVWLQDPELM